MLAAYRDAFLPEQIAQHSTPRKGELHVQLVDPPHDGEIGSRHRPGQIINAASADPKLACLPGHRQAVRTIDQRLALRSRPALPSDPHKKIVYQRQLANLGVKRLHINRRLGRFGAVGSENTSGTFQQLRPPRRDLVRVDIIKLRQFGQRLLTL
jgi:hypothetical protein